MPKTFYMAAHSAACYPRKGWDEAVAEAKGWAAKHPEATYYILRAEAVITAQASVTVEKLEDGEETRYCHDCTHFGGGLGDAECRRCEGKHWQPKAEPQPEHTCATCKHYNPNTTVDRCWSCPHPAHTLWQPKPAPDTLRPACRPPHPGKRADEERRERAWSVEEFASRCEWTPVDAAALLWNDEMPWSYLDFDKLARVFGTSSDLWRRLYESWRDWTPREEEAQHEPR